MKCPECAEDNPTDARFCVACGTRIERLCPSCNAALTPGAKYCHLCGTPLDGVDEPVAARTQLLESGGRGSDAERRQLTVMFCDLVGSTELSERLDPEDLRELLGAYQQTCGGVIGRYDGHIARYVGDGLLVYFGYPQAHEDDPQRAVNAGLGIVEAIEVLNTDIGRSDITLAVRIGINTGVVVAGDIGTGERREEMGIVGETPNIAARLQALAEPGTVVIGAPTQRLVDGLFICEDLGLERVKGVSEPVSVYRVREQSGAPSRFEASASRGLTPLVGREEELGLVLKRWEQVKDREGQAVLLSGEAGIGKSRIVRGFQERIANELRNRVFYYGSPFHSHSAFHPVIEQLERGLRFDKNDDAKEKQDKLDATLSALGLPLAEIAPVLMSLLSIPADDRYSSLDVSREELKKRTLDAFATVIGAMASQAPVLMVVEDLHWIDPSTLELLSVLIDQLQSSRTLMLLTFRPEFEPPWRSYGYVTALALNRLSRRDSVAIVTKITKGKPLPRGLLDQIIAETDGVPLFLEELTKTLLESGQLEEMGDRYGLAGSLTPVEIPASLKDSLIARLDRLGPVKELAQLAATLGRSFSHELLSAVSLLSEQELEKGLSRLVEAELVYSRGSLPAATYEFKHALVRDAAYDSLLRTSRQTYHQRIAETLERRFADLSESQPEVLAHHWTEAGLAERAIHYWHEAGQKAIERSANVEAISHLSKALDLLKKLPETRARAEQELSLLIALGVPLMATKGGAAPEVEETYRRAREIGPYVGETPQLFPSLRGVWQFCLMGGKLQSARELGEQLLTLANKAQEPDLILQAHLSLGMSLFWLGEFIESRAHLEQVNLLYDSSQHRSHAFIYGADPGVVSRFYDARALWHLGYIDQALEENQEACNLAEKLSHPHSLAWSLAFTASLHQLRRDVPATQGQAEATIALCSEHMFPFWLAWGTILQGWVFGEGQRDESVSQIRDGLAAYRATGAETARPYFLTLLAEVYGKTGEIDDGLMVLNEALQTADQTANRCFEAEMHRLHAELLLSRSDHDQIVAETHLQKAVGIARHQEAKSLELRAAMSLSRLWAKQGKHESARQLLTEVYSWFTEGFDTTDLQAAKIFLGELTLQQQQA